MVAIFKLLVLIIRYAFTLSALSITVITRYRIGSNSFGPWSNKNYGSNPETQYKTKWYIRLLTIFFLFLWVRLFWTLQVLSIKDHSFDDYEAFQEVFELFFTNSIESDGWLLVSPFTDATFLYYLNFIAPTVGLIHILLLEFWSNSKERHDPLDLGRSFLFTWGTKKGFWTHLTIWSWIEPLFLFSLSSALFVFASPSYYYLSIFLGGGAIAMAIQGQARRLKIRAKLEEISHHNSLGKTIVEKEQQYKTNKTNHKDSDNDEAVFV